MKTCISLISLNPAGRQIWCGDCTGTRDHAPGGCVNSPPSVYYQFMTQGRCGNPTCGVVDTTWREGRKGEKGRSAVSFSLKVMSAQFLPIESAYMQQNRYCHRGNWEMWLSIQLGFPEEVFPGDSDGKESACHAGDPGLIPGLGRSPGGGHGSPLQYSGLENPHGRRSLVGYSPWGRKELDTTERLSLFLKKKENMGIRGNKLSLQLYKVYSWH